MFSNETIFALGAMNRVLNETEDNRDAWIAHARKLEKLVAKLQDELKVTKSDSAGLVAQLTAFINQHPDSPLRVDTGKRFKDGRVKNKGRLIYEAAFDAKAKELGITNPAARRDD